MQSLKEAENKRISDIHIVNDYPYPREKVWRVLTDPTLIPKWTALGQGAKPVGFVPIVGTKFQFVAKPQIGWNGIVDCEVLESREPELFRYTWRGDPKDEITTVTYRLEPHDGGTRFTFDHTGFKGVGGFLVAKLALTPVRKKMLAIGVPAVLRDLA